MRWVLRRAPESVDTIPADLRRVRSGVAREARLLAEAMLSDGYRTEEMDPIAALLDLRAQRDAMQGALRANPNGRHTKGGLYGEESDYFGKDREDAEG